MHTPKDAMRGFLALALIGAFMVALLWLFQSKIPNENRQLVTFMLGQLSGFAGAAVVFYFGTSKSSSDKNEVLRQAVDHASGRPGDPVHVDPDYGDALDLSGAQVPDDPGR